MQDPPPFQSRMLQSACTWVAMQPRCSIRQPRLESCSALADSFKGSKLAESISGGGGDDVIRSLGGADVLTGGSGNDSFVFFKNDVIGTAGPLGTDRITDFSAGDRIDIHDFLKSRTWSSIDEVVRLTDGASGSTLSVKTSSGFVDVVTLDGLHGQSAGDLLSAGMLLT